MMRKDDRTLLGEPRAVSHLSESGGFPDAGEI
jgi:hypothetical protein